MLSWLERLDQARVELAEREAVTGVVSIRFHAFARLQEFVALSSRERLGRRLGLLASEQTIILPTEIHAGPAVRKPDLIAPTPRDGLVLMTRIAFSFRFPDAGHSRETELSLGKRNGQLTLCGDGIVPVAVL